MCVAAVPPNLVDVQINGVSVITEDDEDDGGSGAARRRLWRIKSPDESSPDPSGSQPLDVSTHLLAETGHFLWQSTDTRLDVCPEPVSSTTSHSCGSLARTAPKARPGLTATLQDGREQSVKLKLLHPFQLPVCVSRELGLGQSQTEASSSRFYLGPLVLGEPVSLSKA